MYTQTNGSWNSLAQGLEKQGQAKVILTHAKLSDFRITDDNMIRQLRQGFHDPFSSSLPISIHREEQLEECNLVLHIVLGSLDTNEDALRLLSKER